MSTLRSRVARNGLNVFAGLGLVYLFMPIFFIVLFSFNSPRGNFNIVWQGFTLDNWANPFSKPEFTDALVVSLQVAAVCVGRARRALGIATEWAATREQFGQQIGKFQGVSFKLADMRTQLEAAELLTLRAAWLDANGKATDEDMAMAKVFSSEMCQFVTDEAIQILGGMGLMDELPLERMWRDTRVDRIWDGTSEIQRHIISRQMLRRFGG